MKKDLDSSFSINLKKRQLSPTYCLLEGSLTNALFVFLYFAQMNDAPLCIWVHTE